MLRSALIRSRKESGRLVEVRMGMPFVERRDELSPDQIRLANTETAVMLVVDVGFLNSLHGQAGDFVEAELDGGVEPGVGRNLLGNPGTEPVA